MVWPSTTDSSDERKIGDEKDVEIPRVKLDPDTIHIRELRVDIYEEVDDPKAGGPHEAKSEEFPEVSRANEKDRSPDIILLEKDRQLSKESRGEFEISKTTLTQRVLENGKEMEYREIHENLIRRHTEEEMKMAPTYNLEHAFQNKAMMKPLVLKDTECKVIIVYSTYAITVHEEVSTRRTINFFEARHFPIEYVDAALRCCQDRRAVLEKVSGLKTWWAPKFPQIFIRLEDESVVYVGDWDRVQELLDCEGLSRAFVKQNKIPTFSSVFGNFININDTKRSLPFKGNAMRYVLI